MTDSVIPSNAWQPRPLSLEGKRRAVLKAWYNDTQTYASANGTPLPKVEHMATLAAKGLPILDSPHPKPDEIECWLAVLRDLVTIAHTDGGLSYGKNRPAFRFPREYSVVELSEDGQIIIHPEGIPGSGDTANVVSGEAGSLPVPGGESSQSPVAVTQALTSEDLPSGAGDPDAGVDQQSPAASTEGITAGDDASVPPVSALPAPPADLTPAEPSASDCAANEHTGGRHAADTTPHADNETTADAITAAIDAIADDIVDDISGDSAGEIADTPDSSSAPDTHSVADTHSIPDTSSAVAGSSAADTHASPDSPDQGETAPPTIDVPVFDADSILAQEARHFLTHIHHRQLGTVTGFDETRQCRDGDNHLHGSVDDFGRIILQWDAIDTDTDGAVIYRVISSYTRVLDTTPDKGDHRELTTGRAWAERNPARSGVQVYQVWAYVGQEGETTADAERITRRVPVLVGTYTWVAPVTDIAVEFIDGKIVGTWAEVPSGASFEDMKVAVYVATDDVLEVTQDEYRRCADTPNTLRFEWRPDRAGRTYTVVVCRTVRIGDTVISSDESEPVSVAVDMTITPAEISVTPGLVYDNGQTPEEYEVTWDPAGRSVRIYCSATPLRDPNIVNADTPLPVKEVEDNVRGNCINASETHSGRTRATWPSGATEMYLTPVTVEGNQARVGRQERRVRIHPFENVALHYRGNSLLVAFTWPKGADTVSVDYRIDGDDIAEEIAAIDRDRYRREGALRISLDQLDYRGELLLRSSRLVGGQLTIAGPEASVTYPGFLRLRSTLSVNNGVVWVWVARRSDSEIGRQGVDFYLTARRDRLPLEHDDGDHIRMTRYTVDPQSGEPNCSDVPGELLSVPTLQASRTPDMPWAEDSDGRPIAPVAFFYLSELTDHDYRFLRLFPSKTRLERTSDGDRGAVQFGGAPMQPNTDGQFVVLTETDIGILEVEELIRRNNPQQPPAETGV